MSFYATTYRRIPAGTTRREWRELQRALRKARVWANKAKQPGRRKKARAESETAA